MLLENFYRKNLSRLSLLLAAIGVWCCLPSLPAQAQINEVGEFNTGGVLISPTRARLNVPAGKRASLRFVTANPGTVRSKARMEIKSYMPEEWTYTARDAEPHPRDAASWFSEHVMNVEYAPGQRVVHQLKYAVPRNTPAGSYWCMLELTPRPVGSTSDAKVMVHVPITFTIGRQRPQVKVSTPFVEVGMMPVIGPVTMTKLPMENEGTNIVIVGATGELKNMSTGREITKFQIKNKDLLPGTKRHLLFGLPKLPDGHYKVDFKSEVNNRVLPRVSSEFIVLNGEARLATEAATLELPPVAVEPEAFAVAAPAGSTRTQALVMTNLSDRTLTIDIASRGVMQSTTGSIGLADEGTTEGLSVAVAPAVVTLRPRSRVSARVVIRTDKEMTGEKWFGLALSERGNAQSFSETVLGSAAAQNTLQPQLEVLNAQIQYAGKQPVAVTYSIRNSGNQALQLVPVVTVLEGGVKMIARLEVASEGSGGILPGVELPFLAQLPPDLKPGQYIAEIAYQYGKDTYARGRAPFAVEAPPGGKNSKSTSAPAKQSTSPVSEGTSSKPTPSRSVTPKSGVKSNNSSKTSRNSKTGAKAATPQASVRRP